jgi:transcription antitermination factor NusG
MLEPDPSWYAVYTRSRHEKQIAAFFERQGIETFLPLKKQWSARQDRKITIQVPALPGYLFVRCVLYAETRALVKRPTGVLRLVEHAGVPAKIEASQIESLKIVLAQTVNAEGYPWLQVGERVRVVRGPLAGAEGFLIRVAENRHRLVISVEHVNQSLSVEVDAYCVERCV